MLRIPSIKSEQKTVSIGNFTLTCFALNQIKVEKNMACEASIKRKTQKKLVVSLDSQNEPCSIQGRQVKYIFLPSFTNVANTLY